MDIRPMAVDVLAPGDPVVDGRAQAFGGDGDRAPYRSTLLLPGDPVVEGRPYTVEFRPPNPTEDNLVDARAPPP